ncbi:RNA pseudouridine synthase 4, mitochondrial-like isoform X2 [Musa acuminata AAA Group]|uniref:RNA pseudouridine synthase 4, mitochondrial-like isoform X2 n=1 Tax=Musa acuminata AAA Group TaxID=214697 RepID=UPI0031DD3557
MSAGLVRLWQRRLSSAPSSSARILSSVLLRSLHSAAPASSLIEQHEPIKPKGKWLALPPFSPPIDGVSVGKELAGRRPVAETEPMSALKWVRRCCPHLPMSLVHKLFRLRQVRRDQTAQVVYNGNATPAEQGRLRRVHRLDRDSSGVLVLGRTQTSTTILHSLFREKTSGALADDINVTQRPLQRKYLALVIGTPRHSKGLISAPLAKIVLEDGKSERIIIADDGKSASSQHALTEYKVIRSSHDYTWLELFPLTGRKHQLRVHCAEVLGTPIVGDHKYGRHAHRKWEPMRFPESIIKGEKIPKEELPFGLELDGGSISDKLPGLHLHCKQMVLPNISVALQQLQSSTGHDFSKVEKINLVAPLPSHMQISWEILSSLL